MRRMPLHPTSFVRWSRCFVRALVVAASWSLALPLLGQSPIHSPSALRRGHSHNDYAQTRPLDEALECGFGSLEADIFLVSGELLVGHTPLDLKPGRTLRTMYLEPLRTRIAEKQGRIYDDPNNGHPLILLIDLKTDAEPTFAALQNELTQFAPILTQAQQDTIRLGPITVVISGNRPMDAIKKSSPKLAFIDGRLSDLKDPGDPKDPGNLKDSSDLKKPGSVMEMPLISDSWESHFQWRGEGPIPSGEREHLREMVALAHQHNHVLRFWATPDRPEVWQELWDAGVDFLGTDHPRELALFISKQPVLPADADETPTNGTRK